MTTNNYNNNVLDNNSLGDNSLGDNFFVTSPIYYVNDSPHIGHAYTSIACDIIARAKRLSGCNVFFLTGTDEHGQKVEKSAINAVKDPQIFCNEVSLKFSELAEKLNLTHNHFIRTTDKNHKDAVQCFWQILEDKGFIYRDIYQGWYSIRDEAFYSEEELVNGLAPTGAEVCWHKEESYFFKLSAFEKPLLALYETVPDFIEPISRRNEVMSFVKSGLKDLSISRTSFSWGVAVPNSNSEKQHIVYVWLDALTNYISALNFHLPDSQLYQDFWCNTKNSPLHIVGKDILRFHAVYWPAFLMAADLPLPNRIFAHGWWTNQGQKISKSLGNTIDPHQEINWLESFAIDHKIANDYFRYFLFREVPFGNDGDYQRDNLISRVNADLVNNFGNLVQRALSMIAKNNNNNLVEYKNFNESRELLDKIYFNCQENLAKINDLQFDEAIANLLALSNQCNVFIDHFAPWKLAKEGNFELMNIVLSTVAEAIRLLAISWQPFIPYLANQVLDILDISKQDRNFIALSKDYALNSCHKIAEVQVIFPRLRKN